MRKGSEGLATGASGKTSALLLPDGLLGHSEMTRRAHVSHVREVMTRAEGITPGRVTGIRYQRVADFSERAPIYIF